jgi:hypothetical protein
MKVELLRLDTMIKPSPISEGVAEIQTNYYLAKDKLDNTTLKSYKETTSGHSSQHYQRVGPGPTSLECMSSM